jgi:hypothetical protein
MVKTLDDFKNLFFYIIRYFFLFHLGSLFLLKVQFTIDCID